ncbi:Transport and Golgi organization 2 homolog [Geodia barretti]|uniref:Transport and Golgi organization 2 homolog n=1 Tax=Geodia barretti TaxID=519541 RepID=A0AA35U2Z3_GEOBA|nr:Transport and Golgi organization 2 homolog [Geodia barretti]
MCVFFLALQPSSRYVLVAANNRDEFFARETTQAAFWDDAPFILAGRDVEGGGTWIGVSTDGKLATLTNIRGPYQQPKRSGAKSRGTLVSEFLKSDCNQTPQDYCQSVLSNAHLYSGFNLITARIKPEVEATYCTNGDPVTSHSLSPGVYGLSNERLDSPWKKVTRGKSRFSECVSHLQTGAVDEDECERQLLDLLCDQTCLHPDENVPTLGFPEPVLRDLNSVFVPPTSLVDSGLYGTRSRQNS